MHNEGDQRCWDKLSSSDFEEALNPGDAHSSFSMDESCPLWHQRGFHSIEQPNWPHQGSDDPFSASQGIHDPYYTLGMQSPLPKDTSQLDGTMHRSHATQDELHSSYALDEAGILDASVSLEPLAEQHRQPWADGHKLNATVPLQFGNGQLQAPCASSSRPINAQVFLNFGNWDFMQGGEHRGEDASGSRANPYPSGSGNDAVGNATSEVSYDLMSSNMDYTMSTNTSWEVYSKRDQFQNTMSDSMATVKVSPNVNNISVASRQGSMASAESVYHNSYPGMDVDVEQPHNGYGRCAPNDRASSRSVEILSMA
jgi:hypothetical protein